MKSNRSENGGTGLEVVENRSNVVIEGLSKVTTVPKVGVGDG